MFVLTGQITGVFVHHTTYRCILARSMDNVRPPASRGPEFDSPIFADHLSGIRNNLPRVVIPCYRSFQMGRRPCAIFQMLFG